MAADLRAELLQAVVQCACRGLTYAAKWAAELAASLPVPASELCASGEPAEGNASEAGQEEARYLLAKTYYDLQEYSRAAHTLQACRGNKAFFLHCYAKYLVRIVWVLSIFASRKAATEAARQTEAGREAGRERNKLLFGFTSCVCGRRARNARKRRGSTSLEVCGCPKLVGN